MSRTPAPDDDTEHDAATIVAAAQARGLGANPRLRGFAAMAWSAFLGAAVSLLVMLLAPESWLDPPLGFEHLTIVFAVLWALALIPAASQALLSAPRAERNTDGR